MPKEKRKSHNPRSFHQRKFQQKIVKHRRYQRTRTNPSQLRIRSARMAPLQCVEPRVSKVSPFWGNRRFHRSFTDFFSFPPVGWSCETQVLVRCLPFKTGVFTVGFIHSTDPYDPFQQRDIPQKKVLRKQRENDSWRVSKAIWKKLHFELHQMIVWI